MRILVTGGFGEIGSEICPELARSHKVRIFDIAKKSCQFEFVKGDIRVFDQVLAATKNIDVVVHLVGIFHCSATAKEIMDVNLGGTLNVLEAAVASGVKRVIMASSIAALGYSATQTKPPCPIYIPVDEKHPCRPDGMYGVSKLMGEELCRRYTMRFRLSTICLRLAGVLTGNRKLKKGSSQLIEDPAQGMTSLWAYVDVRDVAQAFCLAIEAKNISHETFIIAAKTHRSKEDWLTPIQTYYPGVGSISNNENFLLNKRSSLFDISKAREKLGYEPRFNIEDFL